MNFDKNINPYIINVNSKISEAIKKINTNKSRIVFTVSNDGKLLGSISDGDIRRWLVKKEGKRLTLDEKVENIHNKTLFYLFENEIDSTKNYFDSKKFNLIPILDVNKNVISIAKSSSNSINIGSKVINKDNPVFIIAEIGNNHNGNFELAKKLVDESVNAGADCVKFQMRNMDSLYNNYNNLDHNSEDLGSQYILDLLEKFQLNNNELLKIFDYSVGKGIIPLCTPWDPTSLEILNKYGMRTIKIASADLTNHDLLIKACKLDLTILCSTGMSTEKEIIETSDLLKKNGAQFIFMHCNSTYPAPYKDINLNYLKRLSEISGPLYGYSGHERGINVAIAAVALGAKVIEKHISLDKSMEGNDHQVSILPHEFNNMVNAIREVETSLGMGTIRTLSQGELINREILGKSLVINQDLKKNALIEEHMIEIKSPGKGLPPYYKKDLIGKNANRSFKSNDTFYLSDLESRFVFKAKKYKFNRNWGIPVRFHDINEMIKYTNPNLVEFHLSFKDLEVDFTKLLKQKYDLDLIIHAPELFANGHILDLCSFDKKYRLKSIEELHRVVELTKKLKKLFKSKNSKTSVIVNVGGSSFDKSLFKKDKFSLYENLLNSLSKIDQSEVEIIPQTMPPFPWYFGGQRFHNVLTSCDEISEFCSNNNYRVCLDISHSFLYCNHVNYSFEKFIKKISNFTAHLHIADSHGVDGEGLQINEGDIDFMKLKNILKDNLPEASFIPEIWQGHKNSGSGFWHALEQLEKDNIL